MRHLRVWPRVRRVAEGALEYVPSAHFQAVLTSRRARPPIHPARLLPSQRACAIWACSASRSSCTRPFSTASRSSSAVSLAHSAALCCLRGGSGGGAGGLQLVLPAAAACSDKRARYAHSCWCARASSLSVWVSLRGLSSSARAAVRAAGGAGCQGCSQGVLPLPSSCSSNASPKVRCRSRRGEAGRGIECAIGSWPRGLPLVGPQEAKEGAALRIETRERKNSQGSLGQSSGALR